MSLEQDVTGLMKSFKSIKKDKKINEGKTITRKQLAEKRKKNENTLRFKDGVEINTGGDLRITKEKDGLYVVGDGKLIPVESEQEGQEMIARLKGNKEESNEAKIYKNLRRQKMKGRLASKLSTKK